jgi:hypothetical protein
VNWDLPAQFLEKARHDHPEKAARTNKLRDISQVEIICAKVMIGVEAEQGVKEVLSKRKRMRLGVNGKDPALQMGRADALPVVARIHPQVCGPDLQPKFLYQKNRIRQMRRFKKEMKPSYEPTSCDMIPP